MSALPDMCHLEQDDIFVFGSNVEGMHMGGAARVAYGLYNVRLPKSFADIIERNRNK